MLAACGALGVGGSVSSWPTLFWCGAGLSFAGALARLLFPESKQFLEARKKSKENKDSNGSGASAFLSNFWTMLKKEWKVCIYAIVLMSWFNWCK